MILARLSHAIRTQNWFAVALEFVIVIAGVVIGFQVNAWNEGRQERSREAGYLRQLDSELTTLVEDLDERLQETDFYYWNTVQFVESLEEGARRDAQTSVWGPVAIAQVVTFDLQPAALTELINSGDLEIVSNAALRASLARIPQDNAELSERLGQITLTQATFADLVAPHFQVRHTDWGPAPDPEIWSFDFGALAADEAFLQRLNHAAYTNRVMRGYLDTARSDLAGVQTLVSAEIDARGFR